MKITNRIFLILVLLFFQYTGYTQHINSDYLGSGDVTTHTYYLKKSLFNPNTTTFVQGSLNLPADIMLIADKTQKDELKFSHHSYHQEYKGVPILYSEIVIHANASGVTYLLTGKILSDISLQTVPTINKNTAIENAKLEDGATVYAWENEHMEATLKEEKKNASATFYPDAPLIIMNAGMIDNTIDYRLVYQVNLTSMEPFQSNAYFVDAATGEIVYKQNMLSSCSQKNHHNTKELASVGKKSVQTTNSCSPNPAMCAPATANVYFYGNRTIQTNGGNGYWMTQNCCPGKTGVQTGYGLSLAGPLAGHNSANWGINHRSATTALYTGDLALEYFRVKHNRWSYDNLSSTLKIEVDDNALVGGAFWFNGVNVIKIGTVAPATNQTAPHLGIDVMTHELYHGIKNNQNQPFAIGETGAINESFGDIMGILADFYSNPNNTADWVLGNESMINGIRNFANPSALNHPDTYGGQFWDATGVDIHRNGAVQNYMFYLLCNGGVGTNDLNNSYCVQSIGMATAEKIAFATLLYHFSPLDDFLTIRQRWLDATTAMYGNTSNEYYQVANAWYAVGVGPFIVSTNAALTQGFISASYCNGDIITLNGAASTGIINSHVWTVDECTSTGQLIVNGAQMPPIFTPGQPGVLQVLTSWPTMPCNKFYKATLYTFGGCSQSTTSASVIFYYSCGTATLSLTGSSPWRCVNTPAWLVFTATGAINTSIFQLPSTTSFYTNGPPSAAIQVSPVNTATYRVVAYDNNGGCRAQNHTVRVLNCGRLVDWTWKSDYSSTGKYIMGRIADPGEGGLPGFGQAWYVQELESGSNQPMYTISNPSCWNQSNLEDPITLKGFNPANEDYSGTVTSLDCDFGDGLFQYGHTYRITRAAWNDINPYEEYSVILTPTTSFTGDGGFDIIADPGPNRFENWKQSGSTGLIQRDSKNTISVYPNPTNGIVHVKNPAKSSIYVEVLDALGNVVRKVDIAAASDDTIIQLNGLNPGIYLMHLYSDNKVQSQKILLH